jgi:hypothetical protein
MPHDQKQASADWLELVRKIRLPNVKADRDNQPNSNDQTTGPSQKTNTPTGLPKVRFK